MTSGSIVEFDRVSKLEKNESGSNVINIVCLTIEKTNRPSFYVPFQFAGNGRVPIDVSRPKFKTDRGSFKKKRRGRGKFDKRFVEN
jgi:hypothetical protein